MVISGWNFFTCQQGFSPDLCLIYPSITAVSGHVRIRKLLYKQYMHCSGGSVGGPEPSTLRTYFIHFHAGFGNNLPIDSYLWSWRIPNPVENPRSATALGVRTQKFIPELVTCKTLTIFFSVVTLFCTDSIHKNAQHTEVNTSTIGILQCIYFKCSQCTLLVSLAEFWINWPGKYNSTH